VDVFSATSATQDPHYIRARPSLIAKIRQADLLICSGAGLEVGWLPLLLEKASEKIQIGNSGHIAAADFIKPLEKPQTLDRSNGDIHPEGNPHIHLNPHNISLVAIEILNRLVHIDTKNSDSYKRNYDEFTKKWLQAIKNWEHKASNLRGSSVIVHHKSFTYLIDWLGLKEIASLEPKPGIPPTSSHLEGLLKLLKEQPARLIIRTPYDKREASLWLMKKTGIKAIVLPYTVGGNENSDNLFSMFDDTINLLIGENHAE
jgi:zinc/manganese transport system substrate-binding protein